MDAFSMRDLTDLATHRSPWCLSIYMPVYRGGDGQKQNPLRLDNLAGQAEERLIEHGLQRPAALQMVAAVRELPRRVEFWNDLSDGLALFVTPDSVRSFRLPCAFGERLVVSNRFHVKPLVPLAENGRFLVLAVSAKSVRLFEADRYAINAIEPDGLPTDMAAALNFVQRRDEPRRLPSGDGSPIERTDHSFRGPGGSVNVTKDETLEFFHAIERGLSRYLAGKRTPLVFAGAELLFPIFKETCSYKHVMPEFIEGNPDGQSADQLHAAAWPLVSTLLDQAHAETLQRAHHAASTDLGLTDLPAVLAACEQGQVGTLLADVRASEWGIFDPTTKAVHLGEENKGSSEDLIDLAINLTLRNSGRVMAFPAEQLPNHSPVAAILRYPAHATATSEVMQDAKQS